MAKKNVRNMKVCGQSGYKYETVPAIILKGKWLEFLGISPETAEQDACKIEHTLSKETYTALRKHIIEEMGEE